MGEGRGGREGGQCRSTPSVKKEKRPRYKQTRPNKAAKETYIKVKETHNIPKYTSKGPKTDYQTSKRDPHKPRLVVSRSTCPPQFPSPLANSFIIIIGTAVINNNSIRDSVKQQKRPTTVECVLLLMCSLTTGLHELQVKETQSSSKRDLLTPAYLHHPARGVQRRGV